MYLFLFDTVYQVEINPDLLPGETGNAAVDLALTKLRTPYSQDLRNQEGYFDCRSFTYWVYRQLGVSLTYDGSNTAAVQGRYIAESHLAISYDGLAPGDLIFYSIGVNNRYLNIDHVAIYVGDWYVVDASIPRKRLYTAPFLVQIILFCVADRTPISAVRTGFTFPFFARKEGGAYQMSKKNREDNDIYIIPPNFIESGTIFGGTIKLRNAAEALLFSLLIGFPVFHLPVTLTTKIIIACLTVLPVALFAIIGIGGENLSSFGFNFLIYLKTQDCRTTA